MEPATDAIFAPGLSIVLVYLAGECYAGRYNKSSPPTQNPSSGLCTSWSRVENMRIRYILASFALQNPLLAIRIGPCRRGVKLESSVQLAPTLAQPSRNPLAAPTKYDEGMKMSRPTLRVTFT